MSDATAAPRDRMGSSRGTGVVVGVLLVVAVVIAAVALASWISGLERSPAWGGPVFAVVTAVAIVALVVLTTSWTDRRTWLGVAGLVMVAVGSGIGWSRTEHWTGQNGSKSDRGDVVATLNTWWPLVALGLAVGLGALVWSLAGTGEARSRVVLATGSLLMVGVGYATVAVVTRGLVVGQWISGRPIRRRGRAAVHASPSRSASEKPTGGAGELWLDAAADEAAAVVAFTELAARLRGVGAPGALADRCIDAATDEVRHERVCRRIAARHGSESMTRRREGSRPAPARSRATRRRSSASRTVDVVRLAVESFVDGVVGEGFAARRLEAGSSTIAEADRRALHSMSTEEQQHADLGADIVRWSLDAHPFLVGGALHVAARRLPIGVGLPTSHRRLLGADLQQAGLVDVDRATELWSAQRTDALEWLDLVLITV